MWFLFFINNHDDTQKLVNKKFSKCIIVKVSACLLTGKIFN